MPIAFADTSFWAARLLRQDRLHRRAREVIEAFHPVPIFTSTLVLTEFLNMISARGEFVRRLATRSVDVLRSDSDCVVIEASNSLFDAALKLYRERQDQSWSLTDCASFVVMQRNGIVDALTHTTAISSRPASAPCCAERKRMRPWVLLVLIALAGCDHTPRVAPERLASVRSVGIISAMPEEATVQIVGITAFGNSRQPVSIADWGINDRLTRELREHLDRRFAVREISYDRSNIIARSEPAFTFSPSPLPALVAELAKANPADIYLVIARAAWEDPIGGSNQTVEGIGVYRRAQLVREARVAAFAFYRLTVFDGRTFERLASAQARMNRSAPFRFIDGAAWPDNQPPTEAQKARWREVVEALIAESMPFTLQYMNLR